MREADHETLTTNKRGSAPAGSVLRTVLRRWRLLLVSVLVGLAVASVVAVTLTPSYRATVSVMVVAESSATTVGDAYQSTLIGINLATGYARLMNTTDVAAGVIKELQLGEKAASLQTRIDAAPVSATNLITVSVTASDAVTAARIANAIPAQFNATLESFTPGRTPTATVKIVQPATPPTAAAQPRPITIYAVALVLAVMIGVTLAVRVDRRTARIALRRQPLHAHVPDGRAATGPSPHVVEVRE